VIGGLFGHEETTAANNELIVFITPYVVDELDNMLPEAQQELKDNKAKLEGIQQELKNALAPIRKQGGEVRTEIMFCRRKASKMQIGAARSSPNHF
jgi:type II secretory pathway component GspD/PulD (secretin)